jgi:hypothetical protein
MCRAWATVILGRIHPNRAVSAIGLLRESLKNEDAVLRSAAATTLVRIGHPARDAIGDLETAARVDSNLRDAAIDLRYANTSPDARRFEGLRLVGVAKRDDVNIAYLLSEKGNVWEVGQGQRFLDGEIARVESEAVEFHGERVADDFSIAPCEMRVTLFGDCGPESPAGEPTDDAQRASVNFDGDLAGFAMLVAQAYRLNVIVEAGASGPVHVSLRDAAWKDVVERGLSAGGFDYVIDHGCFRFCRRDQVGTLRRLLSEKWSGHKVSCHFRDGDMDDVARLFADISGLTVELPPGPHDPVTIAFNEVPWDQTFEAIVASRGLTCVIDESRIRVEALQSNH